MVAPVSVSERPAVSVIVPARNEEACLGACLDSLVAQAGVGFEVIVVDDGSSDRTRAIAESFPGVQVIEPGPLPSGWSGKNNAVTAGAKRARGEWLLFTDADTVHRPGSLARALAEAREHSADLLSYSPEQEVHGFWERAVMPVIFGELAATYRPSAVSNPKSMAAAANGQYLLVSREAYDAVGGHTEVGTSLLEDVALARAVKMSGRRIFFRFGGDMVRARMYRSVPQLTEGWTKNLALLFAEPLWLAFCRFSEFALIVGGLSLLFLVHWTKGISALAMAGLALSGSVCYFFVQRVRNAHFSWQSNLLALFGLPFFAYLLLRSRIFHKRGTVSWKGRTYAGGTARTSPLS
jgi:glycosyltransferase involved in cell wall biosynthesis